MMRTLCAVLALVVVLPFWLMFGAVGGVSFTGRIVAYRPVDFMQVASSVENREVLLFRAAGSKHRVLKLVYVHQGYSDITAELRGGLKDIRVNVRRDSSCDGSVGSYETDARQVPVDGSPLEKTRRVVFSGDAPPASSHLSCYLLVGWKPVEEH